MQPSKTSGFGTVGEMDGAEGAIGMSTGPMMANCWTDGFLCDLVDLIPQCAPETAP